MALVRVCDKCLKIIEKQEFVSIDYEKRIGDNVISSRLNLTLCEECFEREFGKGHLEAMVNNYLASKRLNKIELEGE